MTCLLQSEKDNNAIFLIKIRQISFTIYISVIYIPQKQARLSKSTLQKTAVLTFNMLKFGKEILPHKNVKI
jgi:hypothetical protein